MKREKKYCSFHEKECYIWKNYKGMKFCKEGWLLYNKDNKPDMKKPVKKALIDLLDKLLRKYLLLTREGKCFTCGLRPKEKKELQVGHFVKRGVLSLRWDLLNVQLQCENCNCFLGGNLEEYEKKLGETAEWLKSKARDIVKLSEDDFQDKITELKKLINNVPSNKTN